MSRAQRLIEREGIDCSRLSTRSARPRTQLTPGPARPAVRHPRCAPAHRRFVADPMGLATTLHARIPQRPAWYGVPGTTESLLDERRDGRLPRGVRRPILIFRCGVGAGSTRSPKKPTASWSSQMINGSRRTMSCWPGAPTRCPTCPASPTSSTPAFCNSTRVNTGRRPSCKTVTCSCWAPPTLEQEIALEASATHRTWISGRHPGSEPTRPGSRSTGSSPRPSGSTSLEFPA
jgi:hypothetical protein